MKKEQYIIGLMSGSSLDGLDIAYCKFDYKIYNEQLHIDQWELVQADSANIPDELKYQLSNASKLGLIDIQILDILLGQFMGNEIFQFIDKHQITKIDFIASHGHTIVHKPDKGISLQIGDGKSIANITQLPVINQFRNQDIAQGGQGAPVAPIADKFLFNGFDLYLNLGGIANIAYVKNNQWYAYDIAGANQLLNALSNQIQLAYDDKGQEARSGQKIDALFNQLNSHAYLDQKPPKSLDNQFVFQEFTKLALDYQASIADKLSTVCHHIAYQISIAIQNAQLEKDHLSMICTGGGTFNDFLIELIKDYCEKNQELALHIPKEEIIIFKEAALMALMGLLHSEQIPNVMASVTGANQDTINGELHHPEKQNTYV